MMECYSFEKIAKNYGKKQVLWGVSGKFPPGSTVGLLGLNGAGKTTLLNILGNCDRDFSGYISLRGNAVAYMPTRLPFPTFWQVREVFAFYRRFYKFDNFLADQMLREANISPRSRLSALSDGMRRMVTFICCYCTDAQVYLLDEPLTNLDINLRAEIADLLIGRAMEDKVTVIATHEIKEFENLFTHICILRGGELSPLADAEDIRAEGMSIEEYYRGKAK